MADGKVTVVKADADAGYAKINACARQIVEQIESTYGPGWHVGEYEWLLTYLSDCLAPEYQTRYKTYWAMFGAGLGHEYCDAYFEVLQITVTKPTHIGALAGWLYAIPTDAKGTRKLQFSFATKLLHMVDPRLPMWDSRIAGFYRLCPASSGTPIPERIKSCMDIHDALRAEYARVIAHDLLKPAMNVLRDGLRPRLFTDERVIDTLIWGYQGMQKKLAKAPPVGEATGATETTRASSDGCRATGRLRRVGEQAQNRPLQIRDIVHDDVPHFIKVYAKVVMNQDVSHPDYGGPRRIGSHLLQFIGHRANRLADDPDVMHHPYLDLLVGQKGISACSGFVLDSADSFEHIVETIADASHSDTASLRTCSL